MTGVGVGGEISEGDEGGVCEQCGVMGVPAVVLLSLPCIALAPWLLHMKLVVLLSRCRRGHQHPDGRGAQDHGHHHADRPGGCVGVLVCGCVGGWVGGDGALASSLLLRGGRGAPGACEPRAPIAPLRTASRCIALRPAPPLLTPHHSPQDHYPEMMWKCIIINAPTTFRWGAVGGAVGWARVLTAAAAGPGRRAPLMSMGREPASPPSPVLAARLSHPLLIACLPASR